MYGSHVSTTLFPILACIAANEDTEMTEKIILLLFYFPYLLFPFWLMVIAFVSEDVFFGEVTKGSNKLD